jgi:hypothetical protein
MLNGEKITFDKKGKEVEKLNYVNGLLQK